MTYPHRVLAACLLLGWSGVASAQTPALVPLKSLSSLDANADRLIVQAVMSNLGKLESPEPAQQSAGRDTLISDAESTSAAYKERYSAIVSAQYLALDVAGNEPRARLNAAVALARIAGKTGSAKLEFAVLEMLDPKQPEAVQLWALKAAGAILADSMKADPQRKLLGAIVPSIKERLTTPMTDEAYAALNVPVGASNPAVVDEILRLTEARMELYRANPLAVDEAAIDGTGLSTILTTYWMNPAVVNKAQQLRTMQVVCHLLAVSAQLGDAAGAGTPERDQFQVLVNKIVASVFVAASNMQQQGGVAQAGLLVNTAQSVLGQVKPQNALLAPSVQPVCPAIKQIPGFQGIQDPAAPGGNQQ